jgi:HSP20 family molecular chaperone IbpA
MYRSLVPGGLFAEVDRLPREMQQALDSFSPRIRGFARGSPAPKVGSTPTSVEVYAFAPGIDPAKIKVNLDARRADHRGRASRARRRRQGHRACQRALRRPLPPRRQLAHAQPRRIAVQVA